MAAFGQTFDSNTWLVRSRTSTMYRRVGVGSTPAAGGSTVWVSWWLTTWVFIPPPFFDQGRLIRSTWLSNPGHGYAHIAPFIARDAAAAGPTVWNKWFFNTAYTPPSRAAFFAGGGVYHYAGGAATLGAQRKLSILAATGIYSYQGPPGHSDYGIDAEVIPYLTVGGDITSPGNILTVVATAIGWAVDPTTGIAALYSPGDVFLVARTAFSDSRTDYLAGKPGSPLYGWMTVVPDGTPLTNPTNSGVPVYDFQPPPRRLVF